jgi:integrase
MQGSIKAAGEGRWRLRFDLGFDAEGGRKQRSITFKGTRKEAEQKLRDELKSLDDDTYIEPRKVTLGQLLREWIDGQRQAGILRASSLRRYGDIVADIQHHEMSMLPLQKLREKHLERYYASVSKGSRQVYHTVIRRALRRAVKERLISTNPAAEMENAPRRSRQRLSDEAEVNCWNAADAKKFLDYVKHHASKQEAALFAFMLDTGCRKNEACALLWSDIDWQAGTVTIERQLLSPTVIEPEGESSGSVQVGPTKTGVPRTTAINPETLRLLREHRAKQSEIKMANRTIYTDLGLVFAKSLEQKYSQRDHLGHPLQSNNLGERMLDPLIKAAKVKRITVHGLRHTAATLMLLAKIPAHVAAARLGHADVNTTLTVYAHALRDSHESAAITLGKVLHG